MKSGRLRHLVTFSQPVFSSGEATDNPKQWEKVLTVDSDVRPASIKEIEAAQGLLMQTDIVVECRWRTELSAMDNQWRVDSKLFKEACRVITACNPDFCHRMWRVTCRAQSLTDD